MKVIWWELGFSNPKSHYGKDGRNESATIWNWFKCLFIYKVHPVKLPQFFIVYSYGAHGTKHHTGCSINNGKNPLVLKGGKEKKLSVHITVTAK